MVSLTIPPFSLKEMNDALLVNTHLTYDERLAKAQTYNRQAQFLSSKLQIVSLSYTSWSVHNCWGILAI
jgi:hypothetical protein